MTTLSELCSRAQFLRRRAASGLPPILSPFRCCGFVLGGEGGGNQGASVSIQYNNPDGDENVLRHYRSTSILYVLEPRQLHASAMVVGDGSLRTKKVGNGRRDREMNCPPSCMSSSHLDQPDTVTYQRSLTYARHWHSCHQRTYAGRRSCSFVVCCVWNYPRNGQVLSVFTCSSSICNLITSYTQVCLNSQFSILFFASYSSQDHGSSTRAV